MNWTQIAERNLDDVVILDLRGHMTLADHKGQLLAKIRQLRSEGRTKILLNLTELPYVDSEGLGEIVSGCTTARRAGGVLRLCGVGRRIQDLLAATRLSTFLEAFDSEQDAVQSFSTRV
jgi:anti-anti-sigma factor